MHVIFSSDGGLTWGNETTVTSSSHFTESNYVQLSNSHIVGILRNDNGTDGHGYWMTSSSDNGATWSAPLQVLDGTAAAQPGRPALSITPSGKLFLVGRFGSGTGTGYSYSSDNGATWSAPTMYYVLGSKSYGAYTYAQGFYDTTTATLMYIIGEGGYTAAKMTFQQFYLQ